MLHATGIHLVGRLAEREPAVRPVLERIGGIATDRDELWQQMLNGRPTERQFPPEGWGIGGVPDDVARADEVATRRAAAT